MALRQSVQEQNAATRESIADLAQRFRRQPLDFPALRVALSARSIDLRDGILAKLDVVPEQEGDFLSGYWVTSNRNFIYFEIQSRRNDPAAIEIEAWDEQPQLRPNAHQPGIGKNFAHLALEVLEEMNSRVARPPQP